ncbi:MAG TPA: hypothetical protein PKE04_19820, partial [Clostridia bacterium]|nr:hypothetical protein [Clostridia bacterium]
MKKRKIPSLLLCLLLALLPWAGSFSLAQADEPPVPLTIYKTMHTNLQQYITGYEELEFYQQLSKDTNTVLTFMTPPVGQEREQLNLILASRDFPDIFLDSWSTYVGGAAKAILDNIIIPLNDWMDSDAPNLTSALAEYPDAMKYISTESGDIFSVPVIMESPAQLVTQGALIRKDWLDDLGLSMP